MKTQRFPEWPNGCWPSEVQRLLVQACLLPDEAAARAAFECWSRQVPLFFIDPGSAKLLLLLYHRLKSWGINYCDMNRLSGLAKLAWVRHQKLLRELTTVLRTFREARIPTMVLKGLALNATVYPEANRLMTDLDVMVPRRQAHDAMTLLEQCGWKSIFRDHHRLVDVTHGCHFQHGDHGHIDLHWDLFHGRPLSERSYAELWRRSVEVGVAQESTRTLCPTHQLLHTCEHGVRYGATAPFRWLADACQILRRFERNIDWHCLATLASRHELTLPVRDTLSYLEQHLQLKVPSAAGKYLNRQRPSWSARAQYFLATRKPFGHHPFWQTLPQALFDHERVRRRRPEIRFFDYLARVNNLQPPLHQHLNQLVRIEWAAMAGNLRARIAAAGRELFNRDGSRYVPICDLPQDTLQGFHTPEKCDQGMFRWSEPVACLQLPVGPGRYDIALHVAPVRSDIDKHLSVRLNHFVIDSRRLRFVQNRVAFTGERAMLADHPWQRLELRCAPYGAPRDPRRLGVALLGVEIAEMPS